MGYWNLIYGLHCHDWVKLIYVKWMQKFREHSVEFQWLFHIEPEVHNWIFNTWHALLPFSSYLVAVSSLWNLPFMEFCGCRYIHTRFIHISDRRLSTYAGQYKTKSTVIICKSGGNFLLKILHTALLKDL